MALSLPDVSECERSGTTPPSRTSPRRTPSSLARGNRYAWVFYTHRNKGNYFEHLVCDEDVLGAFAGILFDQYVGKRDNRPKKPNGVKQIQDKQHSSVVSRINGLWIFADCHSG